MAYFDEHGGPCSTQHLATDPEPEYRYLQRFLKGGCVEFARQPIRPVDNLDEWKWFEWLLRPVLGGERLQPSSLIRSAEKMRCATELDLRIHRAAQARLQFNNDDTVVNLNVSARTMSNRRGVDQLLGMARQSSRPERLVYEITETACLRDQAQALRFCRAVHEAGCRVALDDASSRHGALSIGHRWIDIVKFSIVGSSAVALGSELTAAVAAALDRKQIVVVEGIETEHQLTQIKAIGVPYVQGFIAGGAPEPIPCELSGSVA